ncbi:glycosyl hydrolases family 31-domain-containing protein [Zychaea mexicana]|uniref:glycosyl hydrolases family 31-domain-containing protein n=1 Tax=Zychaea mexicana TaxID=64656 RepID=UPI0022FE5977|nr:glycosyl hydrolases family 31-domain-containing protein [Zychaea mexicana]KAI9495853.1 glycosyl hydrolases family 31-domain-containing protein [Zychaea mexicana]
MFQSFIKSMGLAPLDSYVEPRLSIGNVVLDREISTGHFTVQVDEEARAVFIRNNKGRVIWKSLHNIPFLASSLGDDEIIPMEYNDSLYKIVEHDEKATRLQTITRIAPSGNDTVIIYGGLGTRIAPPTHLSYEFIIKELSPHQLQFTARITERDSPMANYRRLFLTYESRKEEDFYGFGEQFVYSSLKGHKVPVLIRERGHGCGGPQTSSFFSSAKSFVEGYFSGDDGHCASYVSVPQYVTSDKRCLCLETSEYASFDLCEPDRVTIRVNNSIDNDLVGRIIDGDSMLDLITEYTSYAGRMQPLPDWINKGVVACIQGGSAKVRQIVAQMEQHQTPVAAVLVPDWCGQRLQPLTSTVALKRLWWHWEHDEQLYPDWQNLVEELRRDRNIGVMSYVNPLLVPKQGAKRDLFAEATQNGYFVKISSKKEMIQSGGLEAGLLDLTNPEAVAWFKQVVKQQFWDVGVSGMMVDMGENLPCSIEGVTLHSQQPSSAYHNRYAESWARLYQESIEESDLDHQPVCFLRSGYTRSPQHLQLLWSGDHNVTWDQTDGLKSAVTGMLSGGFSGFSLNHSDVGGFTTIEGLLPGASMSRNRDLLYRWMELAAFTAVYRTQEGILPEKNAQFYQDEETYAHFAHTAQLYAALAPYRKQYIQEAYEKGWPLMRHLVLYYPDDPTVRQIVHSQYLLGPHLMIAPTVSPSASFVKVYFPHENSGISWRHIWTGKYFEADGSYKVVDTPLGQPAAFVKEPRQDDGLLNDLISFANHYYSSIASSSSPRSSSLNK